jgi:hypothetical protein
MGDSHGEVGGEPGGHIQRLLEVTYVPGLQGVVTWERRTVGVVERGQKSDRDRVTHNLPPQHHRVDLLLIFSLKQFPLS